MMNPQTAESDATSDREAILEKLQAGMNDLHRGIESADPTSEAESKLQLRRYHELGYLANQYRKLKKDTDLVDMDERLKLLEEDFGVDQP